MTKPTKGQRIEGYRRAWQVIFRQIKKLLMRIYYDETLEESSKSWKKKKGQDPPDYI